MDTGATDSLAPRSALESIGLKPKGRRVYTLADGREVRMDVTAADIEFMGEIVGGTIVFGEGDAEPLLGATALQSAGIEVDTLNQRLKKVPAVRLKAFAEDRTSLEVPRPQVAWTASAAAAAGRPHGRTHVRPFADIQGRS